MGTSSNKTALLGASGAPDPAGGAAKVAALMQQASKLEAAMPELASLREMKAKNDEKAQDEDVSQAVAYHRIDAKAVPAMKLFRKHDPDGFVSTETRQEVYGRGVIDGQANGRYEASSLAAKALVTT